MRIAASLPGLPLLTGAALLLILLSLAGCGGGEDDNKPASQPPTPPTITDFSPKLAAAGAQVTIDGSGFDRVDSARIGQATAAFQATGATRIQLTVPAGAASGRIELSGSSGKAVSAVDLTIMAIPSVTGLSSTTLTHGDVLVLTGTDLDQVKAVTLNGLTLPFTGARSATSATVTVVAGAATGFLVLVGRDDVARQTSRQITIAPPLALSSFSPASALPGSSVTLSGSGLGRVTAVTFGAATAEAAITARTETSLAVTVPSTAVTGPITVRAGATERASSAAHFVVVPRIAVDNSAVYSATGAGASVALSGSGLDQVSGLTVSGAAATISARSATQLVFIVPNGVACGPIVLLSSTQPSASAGTLVVGSGCSDAVRIADIEFAQLMSQSADSEFQRLVPGRETWVRAYVTSTSVGRASPVVRLIAFRGQAQLGALPMTGPASLPTLAAGAAVPDAMRYELNQSFRVALPSAWVASGLRVRIEVDPGNASGAFASREATPQVGADTRLAVVMVPLIAGGSVPQMPSVQEVWDELSRTLPVAREEIAVTLRASYVVTSVPDAIDDGPEWGAALGELDQLRQREAPNSLYLGVLKRGPNGGPAGVAYLGAPIPAAPARAALIRDAFDRGWIRTMVHEIGHNLGRPHAPCGNPSGPDAAYPYPGGLLSTTPLFDINTDTVVAPGADATTRSDVMGYCGGWWFSDYNVGRLQQHLEYYRQQSMLLQEDATAANSTELLVVRGTITPTGAQIDSVLPSAGSARSQAEGEHVVELLTEDGRYLEVRASVQGVDHLGPGVLHFSAEIPHPGRLRSVRLLRRGQVMAERVARGDRASALAAPQSPDVQIHEAGGSVRLAWSSALFPYATVTHLAEDGRRNVLTLQARGGAAALETRHLPAGGQFEVALSDGLNSQTILFKR